MQPKFVEKQDINVVGLKVDTTLKQGKHKKDCPKVWMDFMKRKNEINNNNTRECYGVCIEKNESAPKKRGYGKKYS